MDRRTTAIVILGIICVFAGYMAREPNYRTDSTNAHAVIDSTGTASRSTQQESSDTKEQANYESPEWYAAIERPEWWLVGLGIGALWLTWKTLGTLEKQADAALLNAKALIASERAWLTADLMRDATKKDGQWHWNDRPEVSLTTEELLKGLQYGYRLRVSNIGKTPAQLVQFEYRYSYLAKGVTALPDGSGNHVEGKRDERTVPAGELSFLFTTRINGFMALHQNEIDSLDGTAVFHGWVKYRSLIAPLTEEFADYCYVYSPRQQLLERRDEYNTHKHEQT